MSRRIWFDRRFQLGLPIDSFVDVLERLRGTPLRLEERASRASEGILTVRVDRGWSIQEHVGHLADLEELWLGRLDDFEAGLATLRPADLENRATWDAEHNARAVGDLLREFRTRRAELVSRVESLGDEQLAITALHPRLDQPMTVVDLAFFVAEHDDHHLAALTELLAR